MFFTSYFAKISKFPKNIIPVSIALRAPEWFNGIQYKKLAPNYSFYSIWRESCDNNYYIERFNKEILSSLNIKQVVKDLDSFKKDKNNHIALICYEKPEKFCHRHLVAYWLTSHGYLCSEY